MENAYSLFYYLALLAAISLAVFGQVLLKSATQESTNLLGQLLHPLTIAAFGVYAIAAILYIVALKKIPLSIAFPSMSISYGALALLMHWFWNEPFGLPQAAGIILISLGLMVLHF